MGLRAKVKGHGDSVFNVLLDRVVRFGKYGGFQPN